MFKGREQSALAECRYGPGASILSALEGPVPDDAALTLEVRAGRLAVATRPHERRVPGSANPPTNDDTWSRTDWPLGQAGQLAGPPEGCRLCENPPSAVSDDKGVFRDVGKHARPPENLDEDSAGAEALISSANGLHRQPDAFESAVGVRGGTQPAAQGRWLMALILLEKPAACDPGVISIESELLCTRIGGGSTPIYTDRKTCTILVLVR
jgi:hypothetical protein